MWIHNPGWIQLALSEKSRERGKKFKSHLISRDSDGRRRKRWETGRNVVFIADLQSSRSARTPKRKSAKKVESSLNSLLHSSLHTNHIVYLNFLLLHWVWTLFCTLQLHTIYFEPLLKPFPNKECNTLYFQKWLSPQLVWMWNAGRWVSKEFKAPFQLFNWPPFRM